MQLPSLPVGTLEAESSDVPKLEHIVKDAANEILLAVLDDAEARDTDPSLFKLLNRALAAAAEAQRTISQQASEIRRLQQLSVTDEATELLNRRGFAQALKRALHRAERFDEFGLLLIIDLDGFKSINDNFGHAAGDHVLATVASVLRASVREIDDIARIGGDEFAVLLSQAPSFQATDRAKNIEETLNNLAVSWQGQNIQVRASVGCVPIDHGADPGELFKIADANMYANKKVVNLPMASTRP